MSHKTYYSAAYANALKPIVDAMLEDRTPRVFTCAQYRMTLKSLEKLVSNALLYLAHKDQTVDRRYARFKLSIFVNKVNAPEGDCVILRFRVPQFSAKPNELTALDGDGHRVTIIDKKAKPPPETNTSVWLDAIDEFLESDSKELHLKELILHESSQLAIRQTLSGLAGVVEIVELSIQTLHLRKL